MAVAAKYRINSECTEQSASNGAKNNRRISRAMTSESTSRVGAASKSLQIECGRKDRRKETGRKQIKERGRTRALSSFLLSTNGRSEFDITDFDITESDKMNLI